MISYQRFIRYIPSIFFLGLFISHFTGYEHYGFLSSSYELFFQRAFGVFFILFFFITLLPQKYLNHIPLFVWIISSVLIFINTFGAFLDADLVIEQIVEHAIKIALPIWYYLYLQKNKHLEITTTILISLTFIGHGIFAMGWHYIPGNFTTMTVTILNINPQNANSFLFIVGLIDLVCAIIVFFHPLKKIALYYLIFWGFTTAVARTLYGIEVAGNTQTMLFFVANALYRLPHGFLPLILLLKYNLKNKAQINPRSLTKLARQN
jgi:hypothetical protein